MEFFSADAGSGLRRPERRGNHKRSGRCADAGTQWEPPGLERLNLHFSILALQTKRWQVVDQNWPHNHPQNLVRRWSGATLFCCTSLISKIWIGKQNRMSIGESKNDAWVDSRRTYWKPAVSFLASQCWCTFAFDKTLVTLRIRSVSILIASAVLTIIWGSYLWCLLHLTHSLVIDNQ